MHWGLGDAEGILGGHQVAYPHPNRAGCGHNGPLKFAPPGAFFGRIGGRCATLPAQPGFGQATVFQVGLLVA